MNPETAARLGDGIMLTSTAHPDGPAVAEDADISAGALRVRWWGVWVPLWLPPAMMGACLGGVLVGLVWGVAAWL